MNTKELEQLIKQFEKEVRPVVAKKFPKVSSENEKKIQEKISSLSNSLRDINKEQDPQACIKKCTALILENASNPELGSSVCKLLLDRGLEGQKMACEVGKRVITARLDKVGGDAVGGFLRGGESINGFSKEFLQHAAPELEDTMKKRIAFIRNNAKKDILNYTKKVKPLEEEVERCNGILKNLEFAREQVKDPNAKEELRKKQAPEENKLRSRKEEYSKKIDELNPERNKIQINVGTALANELATPPLPDMAKAYLKSLRDGVLASENFKPSYQSAMQKSNKGIPTDEQVLLAQEKIADDLVNNNTSLRVAVPLMTYDTVLGDNTLWRASAQVAQASFSNYLVDKVKVSTALPEEVGIGVHTLEVRQGTKQMHQSIRNAPSPQQIMEIDAPKEKKGLFKGLFSKKDKTDEIKPSSKNNRRGVIEGLDSSEEIDFKIPQISNNSIGKTIQSTPPPQNIPRRNAVPLTSSQFDELEESSKHRTSTREVTNIRNSGKEDLSPRIENNHHDILDRDSGSLDISSEDTSEEFEKELSQIKALKKQNSGKDFEIREHSDIDEEVTLDLKKVREQNNEISPNSPRKVSQDIVRPRIVNKSAIPKRVSTGNINHNN